MGRIYYCSEHDWIILVEHLELNNGQVLWSDEDLPRAKELIGDDNIEPVNLFTWTYICDL